MTTKKRRIIIGITGASGIQYGIKALQLLQDIDIETHLVISKGGELTMKVETDYTLEEVKSLAKVVHCVDNLGATISSGSYKTVGMLVAPCSMRTLGCIAHNITGDLLTRAADVVLKERRKLVLMTRETPLNLGHIRNMALVTEMGGIIFPPVIAFYFRPRSLDEVVTESVSRALDLFDIELENTKRWGEANK